MTPLSRLLAGALLASVLALAAHRAQALSRSGSAAAIVVGAAACAAGWGWAAVLLAFFFSSSLLSRWRRARKEAATRSTIQKAGARDAWQVMANGGVFALAAAGQALHGDARWSAVGLGALAAATADTWATEVGTAIGGVPRRVFGWERAAPGTSGAVTLAGTLAMCAGAIFLGTAALAAGFPLWTAAPVMAGGIGGALADTLAGATVQERRACPTCRLATERRVHDCGTPTTRTGGIAGMDNDAVNLTSCIAGGVLALSWWSVTR